MLNIKPMKINNVKNLKRLFYKGRITKFKRIAAIMAVTGLAAALVYFCRYAYLEYAVSKANIVLSYPEIAQSRYPDGSRFTYYEFINDENVNAAIDMMKKDGKYESFTADDLRDSFLIYSNLENSANASVATARSEGNDFSYVANEYTITFVQPHEYKNPNIFVKFFGKDHSAEFLDALIKVNRALIAEKSGGVNGFKSMTDASGTENYDYTEELRVYRTKIDNIISYLRYLQSKEPDFKSESGMTLKDVEGEYRFLINNSLNGISDYIESSGISKDIGLASNKLNVNIENNQLKLDKYTDRSSINKYAMDNYDHTFTENLINVIQNEQYGLYQARPKTEFDTVVQQKHEADENVAEFSSNINRFNRELQIYKNVNLTDEENKRLTEKCNSLLTDFRAEYAELSKEADEIVTEYYNDVNEDYITAKITKLSIFSTSLIINLGIVFSLGAAVAFIIAILISFIEDNRKIRVKRRLMQKIKDEEVEW